MPTGRRLVPSLLALVFALALAGAPALAQSSASGGSTTVVTLAPELVGVGDEVRLRLADASDLEGLLLAVTDSAFEVRRRDTGEVVSVARARLTASSVRRGRHRPGAGAVRHGTRVGLAVGAGLVTLGFAVNRPRDEGAVAATGILAGFAATVLGTISGVVTALIPVADWIPFDPLTLRVIRQSP